MKKETRIMIEVFIMRRIMKRRISVMLLILLLVFPPQTCFATLVTAEKAGRYGQMESLVHTIMGLGLVSGFIEDELVATGTISEDAWSLTVNDSYDGVPFSLSVLGTFNSETDTTTFEGTGAYGILPITTLGMGIFLSEDLLEYEQTIQIGEDSAIIVIAAVFTIIAGGITIYELFFDDDDNDTKPGVNIEVEKTNFTGRQTFKINGGGKVDVEIEGEAENVRITANISPEPCTLTLLGIGMLALLKRRRRT